MGMGNPCGVVGNTATKNGGGLYVENTSVDGGESAWIFGSNTAQKGGAVYVEGGDADLSVSTTFNSAEEGNSLYARDSKV